MVPATAPRLPFPDLLLACVIAAFSFAVVAVAAEIADPKGALGPLPVLFARDRGERPKAIDAECRCDRSDPVIAPFGSAAVEAGVPVATMEGASESPRGHSGGGIAVRREQPITGPRNDLRADLQAAALGIRSLGASRSDMVRPGVGGIPR
jgi:hypothetical protein